jgi:hypothetical protein
MKRKSRSRTTSKWAAAELRRLVGNLSTRTRTRTKASWRMRGKELFTVVAATCNRIGVSCRCE